MNNKYLVPALAIANIFALAGCSAQQASEAAPTPSKILLEDQAVRLDNCSKIEAFIASDPGATYSSNGWNTYQYYEYFEQNLWTQLSNADEPSYNALMELRKVEYSQNLYAPPALGSVIVYDPATQTNNAEKIEDFTTKPEKISAVDQASTICQTFNTDWWDRNFHIRSYEIK